jgi:hypothetical protein
MPDDTAVRDAGTRPAADTAPLGVPGRQASRHEPGHADAAASLAIARLQLAYGDGHLTVAGFCEAIASVSAGDPAEIARVTEGLPLPAVPTRTSGTHRAYPVDADLLARLAAISDPMERCTAAAEAKAAADARADTALQHMMRALVTANARHGVPQVACYMEYGGISFRKEFREALHQAPAGDLPRYDSGQEALQEASRHYAEYEAARSSEQTALLIRNREIRTLGAGDYGQAVRNADLARATGCSPPRIRDIRKANETVADGLARHDRGR